MDRNDLRKRLLKKAKEQIIESLSEKEVHIIKTIKLIEDLDEISNLLRENVLDWDKRSPTGNALRILTKLKLELNNLETEREEATQFVKDEMQSEFPEFSKLAGEILAAKLLATAGSKRKLAFVPASTIQVLGAEKSLFNHLKRRGQCPKHGHLFNHPLLQKLPKQKRGKAARIIAGKLSIAAKLDYFGKKSEINLLEEVEKKVNKL
ncbi:MAG: RNA-binding protein [Candidatus ainarchaeum sp.]|nr:RNA-binding protein [Candidatus ainarchaeum sp.]